MDRLSGGVIGYAIFMNSTDVYYDRQGNVTSWQNTTPSAEPSWLQPADLLAGPITSLVRGRAASAAIRSTASAAEEVIARDALEDGAAAVAERRPRPWSYDASLAGKAGPLGRTGMRTGRIWINPALKQGTKAFWETYWHEWMHSWLTPTSGPFVGFRQSARIWFYDNSHSLLYGEEALAEFSGTGKVAWSAAFPFKAGYNVAAWRVALEGTAYSGILAGSFYGGYYLNTQLDSGK